jgi:hypothetical protein
MKATHDKPWVAVGVDNRVRARAVSSREIILHVHRMGWWGVIVEHHLRPGR